MYHYITCGNCGEILAKAEMYEGKLKCPLCNFKEEQCYFPDVDWELESIDNIKRCDINVNNFRYRVELLREVLLDAVLVETANSKEAREEAYCKFNKHDRSENDSFMRVICEECDREIEDLTLGCNCQE